MGTALISKMASKQTSSSMKLLLLGGLLLCGGVAGDCTVNIAQGETSFTAALGEKSKVVKTGLMHGPKIPMALANAYKTAIKTMLGMDMTPEQIAEGKPPPKPSCNLNKIVITKTGGDAIEAQAMSDAMINVNTRVREGKMEVDGPGFKITPSYKVELTGTKAEEM